MPTRSHYETLGVAEDATPDQVKRAYRSKAQKHHPDKGGDAREFSSVAAAYEVLGDPQRRLLYDATGQDRERPVEEEANQLLLSLFNQTLFAGPSGQILELINYHLQQLRDSFSNEKKRLNHRKQTLRKRRKKINSTSKTNLAHLVIDTEMKGIDHALAEIDHKTAVVSAGEKLLETYSEEKEPEPTTLPSIYFHNVRFDFTPGGTTT